MEISEKIQSMSIVSRSIGNGLTVLCGRLMVTCDVRALAQTDALRATETGRWTRLAEPAQNRKEGPTDTRDLRDARGAPPRLAASHCAVIGSMT